VVIPLYDRNPVRRVPVVTYLLILANVLVFLTEPVAASFDGSLSYRQACQQEAYFRHWGAEPRELVHNRPDAATVVDANGECGVAAPPYRKVPFVSALTAMFLHGSWLHLLGNLLFLFVFGNNVEDRFGRLRFLLAYLGWGLVATYAFALNHAASAGVVVGASGAIAGVLGAYLVLFPRAKVFGLFFVLPARLPAWLVLGGWFVLQWAYSSGTALADGGGVAYFAHVAGFVAGVLTALLYTGARTRSSPRQ
jgi:membrane associated rhomboid family serine protease